MTSVYEDILYKGRERERETTAKFSEIDQIIIIIKRISRGPIYHITKNIKATIQYNTLLIFKQKYKKNRLSAADQQ